MPARTTPTATTPTTCATPWPTSRARTCSPISGWTTSRWCRHVTNRWNGSTDDEPRARRATIMSAPAVDTTEGAAPPVPEGAVMVTLKIARFNPEDPDAFADSGGWQSFRVPCLPTDRLLNLLHYVKWYLDGTLTCRRSCAHGVCGSDAMRINGVNRLACKVLIRDMLPKKPGKQLTITIEPIRGLPVEKDLVVDMEPFFDA